MRLHLRGFHPGGAIRCLATAALITLTVVGCSNTNSAPASESLNPGVAVPDAYVVETYWQPTQALDLMSPEGTFIRAALESNAAATITSSKFFLYPGFTPPPGRYYSDDLAPSDRLNARFTGTYMFTALDVNRTGASTLKARVCRTSRLRFPSFPDVISRSTTIAAITIKVGRQAPPPQQRGPQRRPSTDVFGDWRLTSLQTEKTPVGPAPAECRAAAIDTEVGKPSNPGWPTDPQPSSTTPTS